MYQFLYKYVYWIADLLILLAALSERGPDKVGTLLGGVAAFFILRRLFRLFGVSDSRTASVYTIGLSLLLMVLLAVFSRFAQG